LEVYENTIAVHCAGHVQSDVCLGPSWALTYSSVLNFPAATGQDSPEFDFVIQADQSFQFDTRSSPSTFLVGVEPLAPHQMAGWKLMINAVPQTFAERPMNIAAHGSKYSVHTGLAPFYWHGAEKAGTTKRWHGALTLSSKYAEAAQVRLYVVDSQIAHLSDIHQNKQCSFEDSWRNFNERHSGQHHRVMYFAWYTTAFFLLVSLASTCLMLRRFLYFVEGGKLLSRLIVVKFLVQDLPQQLCIAIYFYSWYAKNGLRCQMCLFLPEHCDEENPLHWANFMLCAITLLSACSTQGLLQDKVRRRSEDDELFQVFVRVAALCVCTLPFSTSLIILSSCIPQLRSASMYMMAGVPCVLGWGTLLCVPMAATCEEEF